MPRPKFQATEDQRRQVKILAALGNLQIDIAKLIGMRSPKTLRKHFRNELDRGELEANSKVAQTLYGMATSGNNFGATSFWLKCRAGWGSAGRREAGSGPAAPFIVSLEPEKP